MVGWHDVTCAPSEDKQVADCFQSTHTPVNDPMPKPVPEVPPTPDSWKESFSIDSALLSEIGEKLVTTPHVALAELVKNAYDADATRVDVHLTYPEGKKGGPVVEVRDNGEGMGRDSFHKYWMMIGTSHKAEETLSKQFGRPRTGAKGIGRFACRRLGTKLHVESISKKKKSPTLEKLSVIFNWNDFTSGKPVSSTEVWVTPQPDSSGQSGVYLRISGAEIDEWSGRGYQYLKRQLAGIAINQGRQEPGYEKDPGCEIYLYAPDFEKGEKVVDIREKYLDAGWGTLTAKVLASGAVECELVAKNLPLKKITSLATYPELVGVTMKLGLFIQDKEQIRDKELATFQKIRETCDDWGGVQIRYKNVRVFPYGDVNDDWLEVERDKARRIGRSTSDQVFNLASQLDRVDAGRSLLNMIPMRQMIGSVVIPSQNSAFESKADRMGFVENQAFLDLKRVARFAIDWSNVWHDYWVQRKNDIDREAIYQTIEETHGVKFAGSDAPVKIIRHIKKVLREVIDHAPKSQQAHLESVQKLAGVLDKEFKIVTGDLLRLRLIASTATMTLLFAHEVKTLTGTFTKISNEIADLAKHVPERKQKAFLQLGMDVAESQKGLKELMELTSSMGMTENNQDGIRIDLRDVCIRAVARFERVRARYHIDIGMDKIPEGLQVGPMQEGELFAIIVNLLSNSIKAVIGEGPNRYIELSAEQDGKFVFLDIRDSGTGIDPAYYEQVFNPLQADPSGEFYDRVNGQLNSEDKLLLGSGTGLGLSIVRGILRDKKGDATIHPPSNGWNFHLRVKFP